MSAYIQILKLPFSKFRIVFNKLDTLKIKSDLRNVQLVNRLTEVYGHYQMCYVEIETKN